MVADGKTQEKSVSNKIFKTSLLEQTGIPNLYFYGMVEQIGIFYGMRTRFSPYSVLQYFDSRLSSWKYL